jgi:para-aminobenzoate synthetase component 1
LRPPCILGAPWRDPAQTAAAFADEPFALALLSDGQTSAGRWSYLLRQPSRTLVLEPNDPRDAFAELTALLGPRRPIDPDGPPLQGGVAGVAAYELADRIEPLGLSRRDGWPDLACAFYEGLLAFDHVRHEVLAIGSDPEQARNVRAWLEAPARPPAQGRLVRGLDAPRPEAHEAHVADVTARIAAGEIFQANIARAWRGEVATEARPFDLAARLAEQSAAPFAAYLRLPGLAIASNSPERFVSVRPVGERLVAETRPIKGTAPRGDTAEEDARLTAALLASAKDRAENLMIVDLMRNDLSKVSRVGSVRVPSLFAPERFANVSHLVSTVTSELAAGRTALDLFVAAFPAGSITGAPKIQAMKVIAACEPPRGPFFGSIFWAGFDGAFDSSVLIRTVAFEETAAVLSALTSPALS